MENEENETPQTNDALERLIAICGESESKDARDEGTNHHLEEKQDENEEKHDEEEADANDAEKFSRRQEDRETQGA